MNTYALLKGRRAQIFVTVIIVLAIVLTLGAAVLFHSRSFRQLTRLQADTDQAYSLARSGIGIAEFLLSDAADPSTVPESLLYNLTAEGTVGIGITGVVDTVDQVYTGTITSTGRTGRSLRVLERAFREPM